MTWNIMKIQQRYSSNISSSHICAPSDISFLESSHGNIKFTIFYNIQNIQLSIGTGVQEWEMHTERNLHANSWYFCIKFKYLYIWDTLNRNFQCRNQQHNEISKIGASKSELGTNSELTEKKT